MTPEERLVKIHDMLSKMRDMWRDANIMGSGDCAELSPSTAFALGELSGVISKAGNLVERDLETLRAEKRSRPKSRLTETEQETVTAAVVREYAHLGVTMEAARSEVARGKWDDHPAAPRPAKEYRS